MSISCGAISVIALTIWATVCIVEGNQNSTGLDSLQCPEGYELVNKLCYKKNLCPEGYSLRSNGLCYYSGPCPHDSTTTEEPSTTTTTTEEPTTTTEEPTTTTTTTEEPTTTTTTTEESTTTTTTTEEPTTTTTTTEEPTTTTTTTEEPTTTTTTTEEPTTTTEEPTTTTTTTEQPTTTTTTTEEPTTTTITTTTEEPTTTTTERHNAELRDERCPPGTVFYQEQCRKIVCSQGEFYDGRCLLPACPKGTVWRNKQCLPAGYLITKFQIENVVRNNHEYQTSTENVYYGDYQYVGPTGRPELPPAVPPTAPSTSLPTYPPPSLPTLPPTTPPSQELNTTEHQPSEGSSGNCCKVTSPRICRPFPPTWMCTSRSKTFCDPRICKNNSKQVYIKPSRVVELKDPVRLIMPPNPPLQACQTPDCAESDQINCSGCAQGKREECSIHCYNYYCPGDSCHFIDWEDFCALYPNEFGCTVNNGCVWEWCSKKC